MEFNKYEWPKEIERCVDSIDWRVPSKHAPFTKDVKMISKTEIMKDVTQYFLGHSI